MPIAPWVYPVWAIAVCVAAAGVRPDHGRLALDRQRRLSAIYVLYRCLIWPLLTFTIFPPSIVPFWLLLVGLAVDAVFLLKLHPYLRALVGAVAVTVVGYGAIWLQTVAFGTPTDLGGMTIAQLRTSFEAGNVLHMVPVPGLPAWIAGARPAGDLVRGDAGWPRAASVWTRPRPPTPTLEYGPEPRARRPRRAGSLGTGRGRTSDRPADSSQP